MDDVPVFVAVAGTLRFIMVEVSLYALETSVTLPKTKGKTIFYARVTRVSQIENMCHKMLLAIHMICSFEVFMSVKDNELDPKRHIFCLRT